MIPFLDLRAQYQTLQPELETAVLATLRSCNYILGETVDSFEQNFARYCGTKHAVALNSGTSALHLALLAAGVGPGDEVITVPATFVATVAAILYAGATPVFVDVDPVTWTMDPSLIEAAITPRTKAVLPVHFHGRLADMEAIGVIARHYGLVVIEDAAQAHGARRGKKAGAFGDIGCFSFYPGKNLGACGEGGAITTDSSEHAEKIRSLRDWGQKGRYNHVMQGFNFRMDALQAAALDVKLTRLESWNEGRRRVANAYDSGLSPTIRRAAGPFGQDHVCHVYVIEVDDRETLKARLQDAGVATNMHYPRPVHLQPAYSDLGYGPGDFPVSEAFARQTLSLPIYPELTPGDVQRVIGAVNLHAAEPAAAVA
ncbi:DegT/DnrJ/EryC1/StrS family aminotransferase [Paracoccaceae bacterium Fryx2]|nr:DegT/DnrJ/EryC1/StrS family aminotransferase [Paracoccaceae bacterium Fryx2]